MRERQNYRQLLFVADKRVGLNWPWLHTEIQRFGGRISA
jgi:hypothetical protein